MLVSFSNSVDKSVWSFSDSVDKSVIIEKDDDTNDMLEALGLAQEMVNLNNLVNSGRATEVQQVQLKQVQQRFQGLLKTNKRVQSAFLRDKKLATQLERDISGQLQIARQSQIMVVCFVIDGTASMEPWIEQVKNTSCQIAKDYLRFYGGGSLRFGCVIYRDHGLKNHFEKYAFDSNVDRFVNFISNVRAQSEEEPGETLDQPEDVAGGLGLANSMDWETAGPGSSRVLIHIADAPAHGSRYNGGLTDRYATTLAPSGGCPIAQLRSLKRSSVHYYFCKLNSNTDMMIKNFNIDLGFRQPYITTTPMTSAQQLAGTVLKTLCSTVLKTFSASGGGAVGKAEFGSRVSVASHVSGEEPERTALPEPSEAAFKTSNSINWSSLSTCPARITTCVGLGNTQQLKQRHPFETGYVEGIQFTCQIDSVPFADGATRWAFHGQVSSAGRCAEPYVFKRSKKMSHAWAAHTRNNYIEQIKGTEVAIFLTEQWNSTSVSNGFRKIHYLPAFVAEVSTASGLSEYYCMEPLLPEGSGVSDFTKFCNNAGLWDGVLADEDPTLLKFAKFTYDVSNGYLMIADLQGVNTSDGYILTDPVILCKDADLFLPTNLGIGAMRLNKANVDTMLRGC